jgi:hypothetical protein
MLQSYFPPICPVFLLSQRLLLEPLNYYYILPFFYRQSFLLCFYSATQT